MGTINRSNNYRRPQNNYKTFNIKENSKVKTRGLYNNTVNFKPACNKKLGIKQISKDKKIEKTQEEIDFDKFIENIRSTKLTEIYKVMLKYYAWTLLIVVSLYGMMTFGILHTILFGIISYGIYRNILNISYIIAPERFNRIEMKQKAKFQIELVFIILLMILLFVCGTGHLGDIIDSLAHEVCTFINKVCNLALELQQ